MKEILESDFDTVVLQSDGVVLVDFSASWCAPCRQVGVLLEEMSPTLDMKIVKLILMNLMNWYQNIIFEIYQLYYFLKMVKKLKNMLVI